MWCVYFIFFFKQKTAYEMRISDWSSDVCSSDLSVAAVDAVMEDEASSAFCAVRPPGHHATAHAAMGFCLFNNVAVAAAHALERHGLARVAIADFDVHHGHGPQAIFDDEPRNRKTVV